MVKSNALDAVGSRKTRVDGIARVAVFPNFTKTAAEHPGTRSKPAGNVPAAPTNGAGQHVYPAIKIHAMKIGTLKTNKMTFEEITDNLLSNESDFGNLHKTVNEFYSILCAETGIDENSTADQIETVLESGKAISPLNAARCVLDLARTSKFVRGIYQAIVDAKNRFPNQRLEILYAGCGPFAALILPICQKFSNHEISVTLIDLHHRSVESAKNVIKKFGFDNHISQILETDAATFTNADNVEFHIVITETMQKTLEKEPQAAITVNLARHLHKDGIFLPENIEIAANLADIQKEFGEQSERIRIPLGKILSLSKHSTIQFEPVIVTIPDIDLNHIGLILTTNLCVFKDLFLGDYDSGISYPTILHDLPPLTPGQRFEFNYIISDNPHFEYRLIND